VLPQRRQEHKTIAKQEMGLRRHLITKERKTKTRKKHHEIMGQAVMLKNFKDPFAIRPTGASLS
jgi:hypothetical protein